MRIDDQINATFQSLDLTQTVYQAGTGCICQKCTGSGPCCKTTCSSRSKGPPSAFFMSKKYECLFQDFHV